MIFAQPQAATVAALRHDFLSDGGEMGMLMRSLDWSRTALGPVASWPQSLRSAVGICLNTRFPIAIYWGPELALLYNEAWSPIAGEKHPWALGRPAREVWPEIWDTIGPMFDRVAATGEGTYSDGQLLPMHRRGFTEECYFNFTFSPIRGDDGQVAGIFNAVVETTYRVVDERRTTVLRELAECASAARSAEEACVLSAEAVGAAPRDLPFGLLYLLDGDGKRARLAAAAGLAADGPALVELDAEDAAWPFAAVVRSGRAELVEDVAARLGSAPPPGPWPEPVERALVAPLAAAARPGEPPAGFLVAGVSPRLALDAAYRAFVERAASHVAGAVANARAHEEERRRAKTLAELDRAKTAFFANVSHEFRTPLTLLLGSLDEMLSDPRAADVLPEAAQERVAVAQRNALRLLRLVNMLLDFSRVEAGRAQASFRPLDLAVVTAELASTFRSLCERAALALDVDCPALPEPVLADRDLWEKIVLNLLSNAFKFTHEGGIRVSMRPTADGRAAELVVVDTGIGIPETELPRIFERFHRVEGARGRSREGTGIGLALVQELVRLQGGEIAVASEPGRGTAFTVRIPFGRAHLPAGQIAAAPVASPPAQRALAFVEEAQRWLPQAPGGEECAAAEDDESAPAGAPRPRVVLADDNADMRAYLRRLLGERYTVQAVADGQAALDATLAAPPDLVLADVTMPELDGLALAAALRADPRTAFVPVILLSARAGEEAQVEGLGTGADDYLVKPFSARELLARVRSSLELGRARRQAAERERRLRAEAEAMRARVEALIEHLPVGAGLFDTSGRVLASNALWRRYNPGPIVSCVGPAGADRWIGVHPDGRPVARAEFASARALQGEVVHRQEWRFREDDGTERWTEVSGIPVRDADGAITGAVSVLVDVDDARRAEAGLRESEERFRVAADSAPALIWTTDAEGRGTFMNRWHEEVFGIPAAALAGNGWRRTVHPEDLLSLVAAFHDATRRRAPFSRVYRVLDRDGRSRWLRVEAMPRFDGAGAFLGYTGCGLDVTEAKQAEARQRLLIAELNHRVKNTLATVQSLAQQSLRSADTPDGFAEAFSARLIALARAHDLLTREEWDGATLGDIAAAALAPWLGEGRVAAAGPAVRLAPKQALALSMALGELATNAVKYGALSVPGGRVSLAWNDGRAGAVGLEWAEAGGPPVRPPSRRGLGSRLLGRPLAAELGGSVDLHFDAAGVRCLMRLLPANRKAAN